MSRLGPPLALVLLLAMSSSAVAQEDAPPADPEAGEATEQDAEALNRGLARDFFRRGVELSREESWGQAYVYFERSLERVERPNTLFNIAGVLMRLGRGREAVVRYERYLEIAPPDDPDREAAQRALEAARDSLVQLVLHVEPPDSLIRVDGLFVEGEGARRELQLDPGPSVIEVEAPGHYNQVLRVSMLPGVSGEREVELAAHEEPEEEEVESPLPPPPVPVLLRDATAPHAMLIGGGALAAVGAVLLGVAIHDRSVVEGDPTGRAWAGDVETAFERTRWMMPLSVVSLALGAGIAAIGAGWLAGIELSVELGETRAELSVTGRF